MSSQRTRAFVVTVTPARGWPPATFETVESMRFALKRRLIACRTGGYQKGFGRSEWTPFFAAALELPESGGTIGPLPDGTVIEVGHAA